MPASSVARTIAPSMTRSLRLKALSSAPRHDSVVVRVSRGAAAQEHERLPARIPQLVRAAGWDHHAVAWVNLGLSAPQSHSPLPGDEEVDLLRDWAVVLGRLAARLPGGLGQAPVGGGG